MFGTSFSIRSVLATVLLLGFGFIRPAAADTVPPVPAEWQSLYNTMQSSILAFDQSITSQWDGSRGPVTFSAHVSSANSVLGEKLLESNRLTKVILDMEGVKAAGARAMALSIDYPALDPAFDAFGGHSAAYLSFYKSVVAAARARGLKVIIESAALFSDPGVSYVNVMPFYQTLSTATYNAGRANHILLIAQELAPDYLSVITEPDTEADQTGKPELGTPDGSAALLNQILATYRNAGQKIPIGAGAGSWIAKYQDFIQRFAATSVDFIDLHIYPSNRDFLPRAITMSDMALAAGKKVAVSECWLNKIADSELAVLPTVDLFARDQYSFWSPLDGLFLKAVSDLAYWKKFEFLAVFRADVMRGNVDYSSQTSQLHGAALNNAAVPVQAANILAGTYMPLAHTWESLILASPDTAAPATPGAPLSLTAPDSAKFQWSAAADNVGTAGYVVSRDGKEIGRTALAAYADSGLKDGTKYTYGIAAYDLAGNTSAPLLLNLTTRDTTPPSTPAGVTVAAAGSVLTVKWSASTDNAGVSAYQVSRSVDGGAGAVVAKVTAPATSWTMSGAQSATSYCFTVTAIDPSYLTSQPSAAACLKTADTDPPAVPSGVTVKAAASQVSVSWNASTDKSGVSAYKVYRSDNGGPLNLLPNPPSGTTYTDSKVSPKTLYSYRVSACDPAGNCSAQSAPAALTTPAAADTTAPAISVSSPARSARVSGSILLTAAASDPAGAGQTSSGVAGVRFQIDGLDVAPEITRAPYVLRYNTRLLPNGTHRVQATARDAAGNKKQSDSLAITFAN